MRRLSAALLMALCAAAQQTPLTIDQVLGAAFPTDLTAAPAGGKVVWVSNARGVRNIRVAEPPGYVAHQITSYTDDDGQELSGLRWTPDAAAIVYVRGASANPTLDARGAEQSVWIVKLDGSAARKIAEGDEPAVSPRGDRVAFVRRGQVWGAPLAGQSAPAQMFDDRGRAQRPVWSPDGARLSFVSDRGDHRLIGVYEVASRALRYLDPSADQDSEPAWSPDGRSIAFIREPSRRNRRDWIPRPTDQPWSIRLADLSTGAGRQVWKASEGPGSAFHSIRAESQLVWAAGDRLIFPWEADGWTHLYSLNVKNSKLSLLTPGAFEVESVELTPDRRDIVFSSNQADLDRRHLWKVAVAGGAPTALTSGQGIEWSPVPAGGDRAVAFLRSDAQRPAHPAVLVGKEIRDLDPAAIPSDFPVQRMVVPQPVSFSSTDGWQLHAQLFASPIAGAARSPAVIFVHGGPSRQMLLGWNSRSYYHNAYAFNQYLANRGYVVLSVNYRGGTGYGLNFREAPNFGASGASDYQDVRAAAEYLRSRPDVDPARLGIWGGSWGGYLTAMALARDSSLFRAGVSLAGIYDWTLEYDLPPTDPAAKTALASSPISFVDGWRSPVLLVQGDDDRTVKFAQTVVLADALRANNVEFQELVFPGEAHEFLLYRHWREALEAASQFLDRHLGR